MSKHCEDCGNNPAPHFLLYCAQTAVYLNSLLPRFLHPSSNGRLIKVIDTFAEKLKLANWSPDITPETERTAVIVEAAKKAGIRIEQQTLFGSKSDVLRYKINGKWQQFYSLPTGTNDETSMKAQLDSKWHTKLLLEKINAKTPKGIVVRNRRQLEKALENLHFPIVVKPAQGSRGRHSHILLSNADEARQAFKNAKKICAYVMVEEMLHGSVYRFTTVKNNLIAVLRGDYPQVIGDGTHSVKELIEIKNAKLPKSIAKVTPTDTLRALLHRQGLRLSSVPFRQQRVLVGQKIGIRYGGDAVEVTPDVHRSFKKEIEKVASKLNLFILGFDIIAEDITKPASNQSWGIIEINTVPFIDLHHYPRQGKPVPVADTVWQRLLTDD